MHGGIKVYRGSAAAARNYLDADRSRADDYYLAEGTGVARRFTAGAEGPVLELGSLAGDGYEAWVAGLDPDTREPRGRLRADANAVRFVEVIVNGPKSWSLAAELHPDVEAAYEAAQNRAAGQIVGWLGRHATTRVGPRGAQVAVPVERLEAVTVQHYTSRAGDPHRHLHLQVNARVFAAGKWRGIDTVAMRDSIAAVNGIGHAAVVCDPDFRAALAAHGYTLTRDGEIEQLASFVGPFSKRAAQIGSLLDRYEAAWRREHPDTEPGPRLRQTWDARAWADGRPDKVVPREGAELRQRWLDELAALGYRDRDKPTQLALELPGHLDRDAAATEVVARLGAARSAWNAADLRGEVEQLLACEQLVAHGAARGELAEDLTARALGLCVPLHREPALPEHIRALTSQYVLDVEADLAARLAARGNTAATTPTDLVAVDGLDAGQRAAVTALAGHDALVLVEGAAGTGKTTTLAATREVLAGHGRRLVVVTPTLKAAHAASAELEATAGSAAWLAHQHGWRWDESGRWARLEIGELDRATGRVHRGPGPDAQLRPGDLVLVDEAGMLDQDTAHALLTIADETGAQVALVGDRHQLPAVGRGGLLQLAERWVDPAARVELNAVHRFTRETRDEHGTPIRVPDPIYAVLTLQMRDGHEPAGVFDYLHRHDQVRVHDCELDRQQAIADDVVAARQAGHAPAVVVDTRDQGLALNAAIRDRLVERGLVDDRHTTSGRAGQPIGAGDVITTRRNDPQLDVANRELWTVSRVHRDGSLAVTGERGRRALPASYVHQHVELGYATTAYGAQGATATTSHLALGEHTSAAACYVGMTRGRDRNTVHLIATDLDDARDQWIDAASRERADLGVAHAATRAARQATGYTLARPLDQVLDELHDAWRAQADRQRELQRAAALRERIAEVIALRERREQALAPLDAREAYARSSAEQARAEAARSSAAIDEHARLLHDQLLQRWDQQREQARHAGEVLLAGPGRLGHRLLAVNRATETLATWSTTWQPYLPDMPTSTERIARYATWPHNRQRIAEAFDIYARGQAEHAHPDHSSLQQAAEHAEQQWRQARRETFELRSHYDAQLFSYGQLAHADDLDQRLDHADQQVGERHAQLDRVNRRLHRLAHEPAITAQPAGWLERQHDQWQADDHAEQAAARGIAELRSALAADAAARDRLHNSYTHEHHGYGRDAGREGPSFGR
jgi:exodeoxyribonuclease V alpha subunit